MPSSQPRKVGLYGSLIILCDEVIHLTVKGEMFFFLFFFLEYAIIRFTIDVL